MLTLMYIIISILVYIISMAILLIFVFIHNEEKGMYCQTVGDLLNNANTMVYLPVLNTILVLISIIILIAGLLGFEKSWNKIKNITLR